MHLLLVGHPQGAPNLHTGAVKAEVPEPPQTRFLLHSFLPLRLYLWSSRPISTLDCLCLFFAPRLQTFSHPLLWALPMPHIPRSKAPPPNLSSLRPKEGEGSHLTHLHPERWGYPSHPHSKRHMPSRAGGGSWLLHLLSSQYRQHSPGARGKQKETGSWRALGLRFLRINRPVCRPGGGRLPGALLMSSVP